MTPEQLQEFERLLRAYEKTLATLHMDDPVTWSVDKIHAIAKAREAVIEFVKELGK